MGEPEEVGGEPVHLPGRLLPHNSPAHRPPAGPDLERLEEHHRGDEPRQGNFEQHKHSHEKDFNTDAKLDYTRLGRNPGSPSLVD